jgi:hypothetical protein
MNQFVEESRVVFGLRLERRPRRHCYRVPRWDVGSPRVLFECGRIRHADGVFFATRLKENADYGVVERRPVPPRERGAPR